MNLADFNLSNTTLQLIDTSQYSLHLYAKARNGKYLEINDELAKDTGFNKPQEIQGMSDFDLQFLSPQQAAALRHNDIKVAHQAKSQAFIETVTLIDGSRATALSHKMPLYSRTKKILGITGLSIIVDKSSAPAILSCSKKKLINILPLMDFHLTTREVECLFHLIKGKTAKMIANDLSISRRTVEQHLINCKIKLGCDTRYELIETAFKVDAVKQLLKTEIN